jgi:hypothetical protein
MPETYSSSACNDRVTDVSGGSSAVTQSGTARNMIKLSIPAMDFITPPVT